jgi:cell division protease FtsH
MSQFPLDDEPYETKRKAYLEVVRSMAARLGPGTSVVKAAFLWVAIVVLVFLLWMSVRNPQISDVSYPHVLKSLQQREVTSWSIDDGAIVITTKRGLERAAIPASSAGSLWPALVLSGAPVKASSDANAWTPILVTVLATFFLTIFYLRSVVSRSLSNPRTTLGKSTARLLSGSGRKVTFKDFGADVPSELRDVVEFMKDPQQFTRLAGKMPKGVLLIGPPGSGKTTLAKCVAGEANVPFFAISGSEFVEMFSGVGASRVHDLLVQGHRNAPCLIFIDEFDAVARRRSACPDPLAFEQELALSQLLHEMDDLDPNEGVVVIAATNRPDLLDEALVRPGRFDQIVELGQPNEKQLEKTFRVMTRNVPLHEDVDVIDLSIRLHARLPNALSDTVYAIVSQASREAAKSGAKKVSQTFLLSALDYEVEKAALLRANHLHDS